jgi:hypothetical protein
MQLTGSRRITLLVVLLAILAAAVALDWAAAAPPSDAATIYACAKKHDGALRIVSRHTRCKRNERKTSWGTQGPRGPRGATGATGPAGASNPSSFVPLGPLTVSASGAKSILYDTGWGVTIQVSCEGDQLNLTPRVFVTNTAENTYLSSFAAGDTYTAPQLTKMATAAPANSVAVSVDHPSTGTATASGQVFVSIMQLSDALNPRVFYATIIPWAEAQTTTCKFAGGLTKVVG